jgi:hypothetical protein
MIQTILISGLVGLLLGYVLSVIFRKKSNTIRIEDALSCASDVDTSSYVFKRNSFLKLQNECIQRGVIKCEKLQDGLYKVWMDVSL